MINDTKDMQRISRDNLKIQKVQNIFSTSPLNMIQNTKWA